jgi:hypothetical protein
MFGNSVNQIGAYLNRMEKLRAKEAREARRAAIAKPAAVDAEAPQK